MTNQLCVVIPVHSNTPTQYELISLVQCYKILHKYPIIIVAPIGLDLGIYETAVKHTNNDFQVIRIPPKWQSSYINYNKLKLSKFFYTLFDGYTFLLTYELDAFVFKDDLIEWCNKGYDYIGAPWFRGHTEDTTDISGVGNSGFSLRRISSVAATLDKINYHPTVFNVGKTTRLKRILKFPFNRVMSIITNENHSIQSSKYLYEDRIVCDLIPLKNKSFKVAPVGDAIRFSFEHHPKYLFQLNNYSLPTGCHAWWKYDLSFWRPFINEFGHEV